MKNKEEAKEITDAFDVLDTLGGAITGDYEKDSARMLKQSNKKCSITLYEQAYQMSEQP